MNITRFATLLKQKRNALNLSQSKVAELCFLSKSSYNHYERGTRLPTLETLFQLSIILKTDLREFVDALYSDNELYVSNYSTNLVEESTPTNSKYETSFTSTFSLLDQQEQKAIVDIMDSILYSNNKNIK
ncbi:MAG: helix-turn-helix transcriptional regulator [Lachnospiraceae bacterium]|nr:helix-turn-helix transcriptional regulator [Lachnospiraceae bacterium]